MQKEIKNELFSIVCENSKACFSDEAELNMCLSLLRNLDTALESDFLFALKLFSSKNNKAGFYGIKEISAILANIIAERIQKEIKTTKIKHFKRSEESQKVILSEYFLKKQYSNLPLWFLDFLREKLREDIKNA